MTRLQKLTATGSVVTGPAYLKSVIVNGGSAASSVDVRDGTDGSGTIILTLAE